ncbi:DUF1491 family protein [Sphingomonas sp. CGMCC 1.13654]|uniref:DUF1491 family protein n=1 Tax=Sphingomonas chungangi TaxID=2683589 RepID=A0A838L9K2_9SPHN|nr:DUF1491 family protein [Sphingomonas chungangi]MBA2935482.1 DUF1491 family protein [Sphingomonas chungangi]MVW56989.1 DUF1491 family protein [Sphingomonas chungangi]
MTPRLAAHIQVSALIRRIEGEGGSGVVLAKGDREAGAILLLLCDRGAPKTVLERVLDVSGSYRWRRVGPQYIQGYQEVNAYMERRRRSDDDLWLVELDIAGVERFAAEMTAMG